MRREDYYFELPRELIAQHALPERDQSRLMVLEGNKPPRHRHFYDLLEYLRPNDLLVVNDTRVMPARLLGQKDTGSDAVSQTGCGKGAEKLKAAGGNADNTAEKLGGPVEVLLLHRREGDLWETIVKPGKRCRQGAKLVFGSGEIKAEIKEVLSSGNRLIQFTYDGVWEELLDRAGVIPLPPYITEELRDKESYQTVYAREIGSSAAPTAGLHFTPELLQQITNRGVDIAAVTLHVGLGTFRPVRETDITKHQMHSEFFHLPVAAAEKINHTLENNGRIIAVGTTGCRVLESLYQTQKRPYKEYSGWTDIFIYPGYRFGLTDGMITNFHLPESTLLMLVSAFVGRERILAAYK
ncbi:MAG TPA: tRNA preQ1(34) S-adenosylmethionine ribosyltransferase-isomerase QueA, partial [Bacillota bacterium]|nr:tRNA preQ1(34) S-adenosylmethionine ribosyltransferase-isomerase QueA [Bacillota bacterium]